MNQSLKKFFSLALLFSAGVAFADSCDSNGCDTSCNTSGDCATVSCYPNRSQSRYKMRQVSGMRGHTHDIQDDMDSYWGTFSITPGYHQTWKSKEIASCLFDGDLDCTDCGQTIRVQGSGVTDRDAKAWLADYFYLPTDFDGSFTVDPKIKNFILDLDFYLGLDEWWEGAYLRMYGPIVHTKWDLNFSEATPTAAGTSAHAEGYFTPNELARTSLLSNFAAYASGNAPADVSQTDAGSVAHTVKFQGLSCAKFACGDRSKTGFADLRAELGWNFWRDEDYHMGLALTAAAPTGNKCCPNYLFDAVVGNGNHWELGGVLTGHYVFWRSEDAEKHFGIYMDANITHMFDEEGLRTFDLKDKPNSKYMLAAKFGSNDKAVQGDTANVAASKIFAEEYAPVANLTTINVDVSSSVQADIVAWFNFTAGNFSWDLGYNFYARSCEDIDCKSDCGPCASSKADNLIDNPNTWALKGDAKMYGIAAAADGTAPTLADNESVALSASQSKSNIHSGLDTANIVNTNVDNAQVALAGGSPTALQTTDGGAAINTSIQPVFLGQSDINFSGTKSLSHALFTHLSYNFDGDKWRPYLGVGAMVEFGTTDDCCDADCDTSCDSCAKCAPSYWGVWVKGGVSFD